MIDDFKKIISRSLENRMTCLQLLRYLLGFKRRPGILGEHQLAEPSPQGKVRPFSHPMGLDQLQKALLVPHDSLLHFLLLKEKFLGSISRHFSSGISSTI